MEGWIKLERKMLESSAFDNPLYFKVFCWCLLRANTKNGFAKIGFKDIPVNAGDFITSMRRASAELHMHESCVRRILLEMQKDGRIKINATNKFTRISVVKWELYQCYDKNLTNNRQTSGEQPKNNRQTTDDRQEYKKDKIVKKREEWASPFSGGFMG